MQYKELFHHFLIYVRMSYITLHAGLKVCRSFSLSISDEIPLLVLADGCEPCVQAAKDVPEGVPSTIPEEAAAREEP